MEAKQWEEIAHTADWAIRVYADNYATLFEQSAYGMTALLGGEPESREDTITRSFELTAPDWETLLVDWLTEVLYLVEEHGFILVDATVIQAEECALEGSVSGKTGGAFNKHIKAVTFHNLTIQQNNDKLQVEIIFDV